MNLSKHMWQGFPGLCVFSFNWNATERSVTLFQHVFVWGIWWGQGGGKEKAEERPI